jgi:hypothetical protein
MRCFIRFLIIVIALLLLGGSRPIVAQQKPQWMPGQIGLNAGILPSPGYTYANITINYNAGTFNGPKGNAIPVTGTYNVWAVENISFWVAHQKVLGGNLGGNMMFPTPATGSLVADITDFNLPNLSAVGGGSGLADFWLTPIILGWHLKRADLQVMDSIMFPTGRYSPGASNNVGSGYLGNHLQMGTTFYITKNKGTSANLFTDWEVHGSKQGTQNTSRKPGQAFTDEWGLGQVLPLKKNMSQLLQLGGVGYDQWQVTDDVGSVPVGPLILDARMLPHYSVHGAGGEIVYIAPAKNLTLNFKYIHEYSATAHTLGNTIVFGGSWTWPHPKPKQ